MNQTDREQPVRAFAFSTEIARLDGANANTRLAQVLDVEQILKTVMPTSTEEINREAVGPEMQLPAGTHMLVADDSAAARSVIELGLKAMGVPYIMTKSGKEARDQLQWMATEATAARQTARDKIALVLTDLETPEMDGFTLARNTKSDARFDGIYVAKFNPREFASTIRCVLPVGDA